MALWARLLGFCVVASQNHVNMGDSISIGALLFCIKSTKYCDGCPSKMSGSILRVIGITLGIILDPILRGGRKFVSNSLKLTSVFLF